MTYSGVEITTEAELLSMWADLTSTYQTSEVDPDGVVICPVLDQPPHPSLNEFRRMMDDENVRLLAIVDDDTSKHVVVGPWVGDVRLTAAWGPSDLTVMGAAGLALVQYLESRGWTYVLDPNVEGWVTKQYLLAYMPQDGGPWDVSTYVGARSTVNDLDTDAWKLTITNSGADWIVEHR